MQFSPTPVKRTAGALSLFALGMTLTVVVLAAIITAGVPRLPLVTANTILLGLLLLPQAALVHGQLANATRAWVALNKLFLQWLMRFGTALIAVGIALPALFSAIISHDEFTSATHWIAQHGAFTASLGLLLLCFLAWSIAISQAWAIWRRGVPLSSADHDATQVRMHIAGEQTQIHARLAQYLALLAARQGQPAAWAIYVHYPKMVTPSTPGAFKLVYALSPIAVILAVEPDQTGCWVDLRFERRKLYLLDLYLNPLECLIALDQFQSNVLQPLRSEFALQDARQRQELLRHQATEMQLRILQAQVEPHFLFNTMANLRQLYRTDANAGEAMLDHLIQYLRGAMEELRSDASTVGKEFDLAMHYLAIMKIRMGERLRYSFVTHDELTHHAFPPAMLISLIENTLKHGLKHHEQGEVRITAQREGDALRVSVVDNGPGMSTVAGTGLGLSNIRQRLEAIHGRRAWLEVGALSEGGFMSSIVVPAQ